MGDGAGSSSIVVLHWRHLVVVCCCHLLVTLSLPVVAMHHHHLVALHCCYTSLSGRHHAVSLLSLLCVCTASLAHLGLMLPVSVCHCPLSQQSGLGQTWDGGYSPWHQK